MPNLYFFTGDNSYLLMQEIRRWKEGFAEKYGAENAETLHGKDQTMQSLLDAVSTMPFIAEKRLVLVDGIPKLAKGQVDVLKENIHPQTLVLIYQADADKRLTAFKELKDAADEVKTFTPLKPLQLKGWIQTTLAARGKHITSYAIDVLLAICGDDQWTLESEMHKLASHPEREITEEIVDDLAVPSGSQVIWQLSDLIAARKTQEAISFLSKRLDRGEEPYGLWIILLTLVRNVGALKIALDSGTPDRDAAQAVGIHPFAARNIIPFAKKLPSAQVKALVNFAADAEIALKTGKLKFSADNSHELIAVTERLILACA